MTFIIANVANVKRHREILGFGVYPSESSVTWTDFLVGLKKGGLTGLLMITSDAHDGILNAVGKVFPAVPRQRCLWAELQELFNLPSPRILF